MVFLKDKYQTDSLKKLIDTIRGVRFGKEDKKW